ncbi:MAG: Smr/MutS family protein [Proteobacteria bacterium]|nr:Smr/MutS family protein [Pseudomonadota bacterium]
MKASGLHALGPLREALRTRQREAPQRAEREAAERAGLEAERRAFADAVGPVTRLGPSARSEHRRRPPPPLAQQRALDEQAALRQAWSDIVDVESLLHTDEELSFRRPGVGPDVVARLRRGRWSIQGQLDLHGLRRDEARAALVEFIAVAARRGWRCVRIVHGKGLGSPGREPVLKAKVQRWLTQSDTVIAFAQASAPHGGAGALVVLLAGAPARRSAPD